MLLRSTLVAILAVVSLTAHPDVAFGQAPDLSARVTLAGQQVTLAPAVGMWVESDSRLSVAFYSTPLPAAEQRAARAAGRWPVPSGSPAVIADFGFKPKTTLVTAAAVVACRVSFHNFRTRFELAGTTAADCRSPYIGGLLQSPHGMVANTIVAEEQGATLHLPISLPFSALVATDGDTAASSAPAAPPAAIAVDTVAATVTYKGETRRATHGLAWHTPEADDESIEVSLFDRVPAPGVLEIGRRLLITHPDDPAVLEAIGSIAADRGRAAFEMGDFVVAERDGAEVMTIAQRLVALAPDNAVYRMAHIAARLAEVRAAHLGQP